MKRVGAAVCKEKKKCISNSLKTLSSLSAQAVHQIAVIYKCA